MRIATPSYFLSFSSSQRVQMATEPILQVGSLRALTVCGDQPSAGDGQTLQAHAQSQQK